MDCFVASAPRNDVVGSRLYFQTAHPSSPGLTGRSSIPEAAVLEPRSRGVLDHPHARVMTASVRRLYRHSVHSFAFSRHDLPEFCTNILPRRGSRKCRMHAAPAVSCANCTKENAHEHTGSAAAIRHSLLWRRSSCAQVSLTRNSPCDTVARRRCRVHRIPSHVRDDARPPLLPGKDGASW
jgi:hypothetical protein